MQEFSSVTASSYDAESLAPMLTEKAQDGWSVVSIVSAGTNVVAYLTRRAHAAQTVAEPDTDATDSTDDGGDSAAPVTAGVEGVAAGIAVASVTDNRSIGSDTMATSEMPDAAAAMEASSEPAGWGAAPAEPTIPGANDDENPGLDANVGLASGGAALASDVASGVADIADGPTTDEAASAADTEPGTAATTDAAASGVPAGWYADPSGRFELRYWDGNAWTEHVSRAGQQYTDPPVA